MSLEQRRQFTAIRDEHFSLKNDKLLYNFFIVLLMMQILTSVSYTHLDVYKRQKNTQPYNVAN